MIYWIYVVCLILFLYIERKSNNFKRKIIHIIIPLLYSILVGFRGYYVGVDTHNYVDGYLVGGEYGLGFVETGFDWINIQLYKLGYGAHIDLWAYSLITMFFIYLTLERIDRKYYTIAAFCFYLLTFNSLCNGMRQSVVCAVFLYAIRFIEEKKPLLYVGLLVAASSIHASALILVPLYFIRYEKLSKPWFIYLIYIVSFVGVFADLSSLIPAIEIGNRGYGINGVRMEDASWLGFTIKTVLSIIILVHMVKNNLFKEFPVLSFMTFLAFVFQNIAYGMPIITRVTMYFSWLVYLMYPILYYSHKSVKPFPHSTWVFMVVFLNLLIFVNTRIKYENEYYMYWQKEPIDIKKYD